MHVRFYSIQTLPSGQLSIMARPRGGDWLPDEITALREAGISVLVSLLTTPEVSELDLEEEIACCSSQGITYLSLPIPDRSIPPYSAHTFTFLEQLKTYLTAGRHIVLHCRQGLGRAALMAASVLVLTGLTPDQAFAQLSTVRGYPVPETDEQRAWVEAFYWQHK